MSQIPRGKSLDGALALLSDGYMFISKRCHRYQSDIFETRLMLLKVVCVTSVRTQTHRLFNEDEYGKIISSLP
jgi:hypothetical protein